MRDDSRQQASARSAVDIIRSEITDVMVSAAIGVLADWEDRKEAGQPVTDRDLVCEMYAAMRLRAK